MSEAPGMMDTMSPAPKFAIVIDTESTGLDPTKEYAALLEVGAILVRYEPGLPVHDCPLPRASLVIRPAGDRQHHDRIWTNMDDVVKEMHSRNGLWSEAIDGDPDTTYLADEADEALTRWLRSQLPAGHNGRVAIAGAGVERHETKWLPRFLPMLTTQLTYWGLDASPVRRMLELAGRDDVVDLATDVEAKPHRALPDAELHLVELRRYLAAFAPHPGATPATKETGATQEDAFRQVP